MKDYRVLFTLEYYVTAEDEDDAIEMAKDEIGRSVLGDCIEIDVEEC